MEYIVRDYKKEDYNSIEKVWKATGMGGAFRGDTQKVIENTILNGAKLFVLENINTNEIIGTSWLTSDFRRIYLHHFGIKPEFQGKGLSHLLVKKSIQYAKQQGLQIKLEVHKDNVKAINLYKKYGFNYLGDYDVYIIRNFD